MLVYCIGVFLSDLLHCIIGSSFIHLCVFILLRVISPLFSSSILGTYRPRELIFQRPIFLPFHTVHGILKARILKWFAIPFSTGEAAGHQIQVSKQSGDPSWPQRAFRKQTVLSTHVSAWAGQRSLDSVWVWSLVQVTGTLPHHRQMLPKAIHLPAAGFRGVPAVAQPPTARPVHWPLLPSPLPS